MLKPRKLRWIILAVVIAGACGWLRLVMLPAEPIYQGLPLSAYLSSSAKNEQNAREALQQTAKEAIPFLISMFDAHDSTMRAFLARWSRKQSAIRIDIRNQHAYEARTLAARGLALLGTNAQPAVSRLSHLLQRSECANDVTYALLHIGTPAALDGLRAGLSDRDARVRRAVAWSLDVTSERLPTRRMEPLLPDLMQHFDDPDASVRESVIRAAGRTRECPSDVVPRLAKHLADPCPHVCRAAAKALAQFGEQAGVAVSAVTNALANADGITRPALEQALRAIGGSSNAP